MKSNEGVSEVQEPGDQDLLDLNRVDALPDLRPRVVPGVKDDVPAPETVFEAFGHNETCNVWVEQADGFSLDRARQCSCRFMAGGICPCGAEVKLAPGIGPFCARTGVDAPCVSNATEEPGGGPRVFAPRAEQRDTLTREQFQARHYAHGMLEGVAGVRGGTPALASMICTLCNEQWHDDPDQLGRVMAYRMRNAA